MADDDEPIPLTYSGPPAGDGLPQIVDDLRTPAVAAMGVVGWTLLTALLVGVPAAVAILGFMGMPDGFYPLLLTVVLTPLLALVFRALWDRILGRLVRPARGRQRPRSLPREAAALATNWFGWTVLALIYLAVPLLAVVFLMGPAMAGPWLVMLATLVPMAAAAVRATQRRRAAAVLGYLEQAVRLNQPFDRVLSAAARGERGKLRRRLEELFLALQGGMTVTDALSVCVPEIPVRTLGQLAYGERTGQLPTAMRRALDEARHRGTHGPAEDRAFASWYPPIIVIFIAVVLSMLAVFVMPKFMVIFRDFRVELPWLTRVVFSAVDLFWWLAFAVPVALLVTVAMLGQSLRRAMGDDRPSWLTRGWVDRLLWYAPVFGPPHRDRCLADLCDALADAVGQGFPLEVAVREAQQLGLNTVLLRRVSTWAAVLGKGVEPGEGARMADLPPLVAGLAASGDPTDTAGGLRFAARFFSGRRSARRALIAAAFTPAVTLLLGLIVGLVALAMMLPIRALIDSTGPYRVGL